MSETIDELRKKCQKQVMPKSEYIERIFSIYFTKLFLMTNISANQLTILNIFLGITASLLISYGDKWINIIGPFLFFIWCVFDCVDGEIARYRNSSSITGQYLDRLNGLIVESVFFSSLTVNLFLRFNNINVIFFGFSASLSLLLMRLVVYNMYISAVSKLLSEDGTQNNDRVIQSKSNVGLSELTSDVKNISTSLYDIVDIMFGCPGMIVAIFVATFLDNIYQSFTILNISLNFKYIFLMAYGTLLPLGWVIMAYKIVRNKSADKLYFQLLNKYNN